MAISYFLCVGLPLLLHVINGVSGLTCQECQYSDGNQECLEKGITRICSSNEQACSIELRYGGWGDKPMVRKTCKQLMACEVNHIQDAQPSGLSQLQCIGKPPSSVCRCCCTTDDCNKDTLYCQGSMGEMGGMPCKKLTKPKKGFMKCMNGNRPLSKCRFSCRRGFKLVGSAVSKCDAYSKRDYNAPTCRPVRCPMLNDLAFGNVSCTRRNRLKSKCQLTCNEGYQLDGAKALQCIYVKRKNAGVWSRMVPKCTAL